MKTTWRWAVLTAVGIVAYFCLAVVWLPSWLLRLRPVASAPAWVADLVGFGVWAAVFGAMVTSLRALQRSGRI